MMVWWGIFSTRMLWRQSYMEMKILFAVNVSKKKPINASMGGKREPVQQNQ
ncbi:hypothetical protein SEHO0A_01552 [Salmonella enterica subsp. houtenae str. ATCC BAA-1581]|nr:hypothetical protein SEHO0A_01552 [Salmonella enterica subsp. houtenae str. ATCC BAA-1581]ENZ87750.1 hypothetical protein D088_190002 [Salmonella enterica subsp. houtenae serovar 16:z4,z32:-- str. RKS3027]